MAILKKESSKMMKLKVLASTLEKVFRLSEDYDSDESDIEDDVKWLVSSKKICKRLSKIENKKIVLEGKHLKFVK